MNKLFTCTDIKEKMTTLLRKHILLEEKGMPYISTKGNVGTEEMKSTSAEVILSHHIQKVILTCSAEKQI